MRVAVVVEASYSLTDEQREEQLAAEQGFAAAAGVEESLQALGHVCRRLHLGDDAAGFLAELRAFEPDVAVNLCEIYRGESLPQANSAALLELLGIPYTGSGPAALLLSTDKALAKALLAHHGVPVPRHYVAYGKGVALAPRFDFPLIVKPLYEDGSYGITDRSVVYSERALAEQVAFVWSRFRQPAIVEEYIDGREINAALLGNDPPVALPLSEIEFRDLDPTRPRIVGFEGKWLPDSHQYRHTSRVCPASLPTELAAAVAGIARRCHLLLGCRDYSRVDLRLDRELRPFVLEVNANPDISPEGESGFSHALLCSGRSYTGFVAQLIEMALARKLP